MTRKDLNKTSAARSRLKIADAYVALKDEFNQMLSDIEMMQDDHLGRVTMAKAKIDLSPLDVMPIHSGTYRTSPKGGDFEKN